MSVKVYKSLLQEQGSYEEYTTVTANIQAAARELGAICTVNPVKGIITVIAQDYDTSRQAVLDFSGKVICNGLRGENKNEKYSNMPSSVLPFNTIQYEFRQLQAVIKDNLGPYALIKVAMTGDNELMSKLTKSFTKEQMWSLYNDLQVIEHLSTNSAVLDNINKCKETILGSEILGQKQAALSDKTLSPDLEM